MSLIKRWLKTMRFDINLVQKRKKNTTLALGKKHYLHCFGLLTCFSVCVSLWLSGICPLSLCCFPFYFYFSSHAFLLMSIRRLKLAHVLAWFGLKDSVECVCCCCKQPFPDFLADDCSLFRLSSPSPCSIKDSMCPNISPLGLKIEKCNLKKLHQLC